MAYSLVDPIRREMETYEVMILGVLIPVQLVLLIEAMCQADLEVAVAAVWEDLLRHPFNAQLQLAEAVEVWEDRHLHLEVHLQAVEEVIINNLLLNYI